MSFKCAPQIIGLVRGEPKPGQKHRANGRAIVAEMEASEFLHLKLLIEHFRQKYL